MHISYHPVWAGDPYLWAEAEDPAVELLAHIDMHSGLGMALAHPMDRDIPSEMIDDRLKVIKTDAGNTGGNTENDLSWSFGTG